MKINISTFFKGSHPGAILQAYALQRALANVGHSPELLNYDTPYCGLALFSIKSRILRVLDRQSYTDQLYSNFRSKFVNLSPIYSTDGEVFKSPPPADAYLCGSDQVWNQNLYIDNKIDDIFFLKFVPNGKRKISYAASFGGWIPKSSEESNLKQSLSDFHSISVREPSAKAILERLLRRRIYQTLDPTLLVGDYSEILPTPQQSLNQIAVYALQHGGEVVSSAQRLSKHYRMPVVSVGGPILPWKYFGRRVVPHAPGEWLQLLRSSKVILTNSFHGLVFGLLFRKIVYFVPLSGYILERNERLTNLCDLLGVSGNVILRGPNEPVPPEICWDKFDRHLLEHRETAVEYLKIALS